MRMFLSALVLFSGIAGVRTSVFAQSGWYWQNPRPTGNYLSAVATVNSNTIVAVGELGIILRSTDGGATWTFQSSGTTESLWGVSFVDANIGTVVGDGWPGPAPILRTIDGGATWTVQSSGTTNALRGVSFVDANIGTAAGDNGTILRTTDGGNTWTPQSSGGPNIYPLGVSFVDANIGTVVGFGESAEHYRGTILRTTTGGE